MSQYNGWANYPTWAVNVWLDSEPYASETVSNELLGIIGSYELDYYRGETCIREFVEENLIPDLGASLAADLLGAALDRVDWRQIATHWMDELAEDDAA